MDALEEEGVGGSTAVAEGLEVGVLGRAVPTLGLLHAGELDHHREGGALLALDHLKRSADGHVAAAILVHGGHHTFAVLLHALLIGDGQDVEESVGLHGWCGSMAQNCRARGAAALKECDMLG